MEIKFASGLNQEQQQAAHDALVAALQRRMDHQFMQHRNRLKPKHITDILLDIEAQIKSGISEAEALDCWKGDLRKAMEWNTNIDYSRVKGSKKTLKMWDTALAYSADVLQRVQDSGLPLDANYAKDPVSAVHEHIIVNMAIIHHRAELLNADTYEEQVERVRTFWMKRCTVFITKDEEKIFKAIPKVRDSLNDSMSASFNPLTSSPFDRYIAAGYDLTKFVLNPMWA